MTATYTLEELRIASTSYAPALSLNRALPLRLRHLSRVAALALFGLAGVLSAFPGVRFALQGVVMERIPSAAGFFTPSSMEGFALLFLALWLSLILVEFYYRSAYFRDTFLLLPESPSWPSPRITFLVAEALRDADRGPVASLLRSPAGRMLFLRTLISPRSLAPLLQHSGHLSEAKDFSCPVSSEGGVIDFPAYVSALLQHEKEFASFIAREGVREEDLVGAARFQERLAARGKREERFWSREVLGRIPSIGKRWAYGAAYVLLRYARDVTEGLPVTFICETQSCLASVERIEAVLSRSREANVAIVGEEGVPRLELLHILARRIRNGTVLPALEHKRVFLFDTVSFVSTMKDKHRFEGELLRALRDAVRAGDVILVIPDFAALAKGAAALGADLLSLLDDFLASPNLQTVIILNPEEYHGQFEREGRFRSRFETVFSKGSDVESVREILEGELPALESLTGVFVSYPALSAVAESAERFLPGAMPDKALDLLRELPAVVLRSKRRIIEKEDVLGLITRKTGIKAGSVGGTERATLLGLEGKLRERVVGQREALALIAGALRRARAGVGNPKRPMGSFLFLGPTGVGKTETTKALAAAFFGDEEAMIRLDMSEYSTNDALVRLIGDTGSGKPGHLSALLREKPYGVLLLDEFEKTTKEVRDLFLQILDEGFFSDALGHRVNARNLLIIATSNAGADLIWRLMREGTNPAGEKKRIIDTLVAGGTFKPELLNRFDGIVIFNPLGGVELREIARRELGKLAKRLREKHLELVITDPLLNALISIGSDPAFGARPMIRAVQEKVEQYVADKLIAGELQPGSAVEVPTAHIT
ncbi:MAG: hypothetical protein G01um101472_193 [Parcubacteria group bacterium Gr01-1014_72]|nr:MAG: hypothetical protein G01um101472_193 [Parcubacteria group bacterium Gr01-1014_72]